MVKESLIKSDPEEPSPCSDSRIFGRVALNQTFLKGAGVPRAPHHATPLPWAERLAAIEAAWSQLPIAAPTDPNAIPYSDVIPGVDFQ